MSGELVLHASTVSVDGHGVIIMGAAGRGKSTLALGLLSQGGRLVADDRTCIARRGTTLLAWAPRAILGRIEARGVGILAAEPAPPTAIALAVDLDKAEDTRLPPLREWSVLGWSCPLIHGAGHPHLAWAIGQYIKGGRTDLEQS